MTTTRDRKRPAGVGSEPDPLAGRGTVEGRERVGAGDRPGTPAGVERVTTPGGTAPTLDGGG
jgi:hypothetical protein